MKVKILPVPSKDKQLIYFSLKWGKRKGQRVALDLWTYADPTPQQKAFNKEQMEIISILASQKQIELNTKGSGYAPLHLRPKENFLKFYEEFIGKSANKKNRIPFGVWEDFKQFVRKGYLSRWDVTEEFCIKFKEYLINKHEGGTPAVYFNSFKMVIKSATKKGYWKDDPAIDIDSDRGEGEMKDILELEEWELLLKSSCSDPEIQRAAIFTLYTGLRFSDVKKLRWSEIKGDDLHIKQKKTKKPLIIPLHPKAKEALGERVESLIFKMYYHDKCNTILRNWVLDSGIVKDITWHSLRHTFAVRLQDEGTDIATIAGLLGHTSTAYVHRIYKRYRPERAVKALAKLPS